MKVTLVLVITLGSLLAIQAPGRSAASDEARCQGSSASVARLELKGLLAKALDGHPGVRSAIESAKAQGFKAKAAGSAYWPQVSLSASAGEVTGQANAPVPAGPPYFAGATGLSVHQLLYNFGKTDATFADASLQAQGGVDQALVRSTDTAYAIRQAYLRWVGATSLEQAAQAKQTDAERLLEQAQAFFGAGTHPKIDVTRAQASLLSASAARLIAGNNRRLALRSLEAATGLVLPADAVGEFPSIPKLADLGPADLGRSAQTHPALQLANDRVAQAKTQVTEAEKLSYPDIGFDGALGWRSRDTVASPNWSGQVSLSVPLFSGFSITNQREAASHAEVAAELDRQDQLNQIQLGVSRAYLSVAGAKQQLPAAQAAEESARANLEQARGRYGAGVGSIIEISDAEALLASAQADTIQAQINLQLAIADLLHALGLTGIDD